ncbi:unnamed protein product [Rotaria sordida]|uniref:Uncharacterized protein n=1 Tax=Rotaria sordida TaxID=392033 RepID=A0A814BNT6_9BILA|nr:unnamed protein product [Rotaria sordida]
MVRLKHVLLYFLSFKKKSTDFGLKFEPQYAYLDFEVGTINALEKIFPDISIHGLTRIPIKYWNLGPIHLRCNNSVEGTICFEGTVIVEMLCVIFIVILGYNNRLQYRFGVHPQLWSFIHFLEGEESLVMTRASQIRSGNYRHKAMPFSNGNEVLRKKTKQLKNLSRLFQLGAIDLKQYITNLSSFVGEPATKQKKKNNHINNTTTVNNAIDDNDI